VPIVGTLRAIRHPTATIGDPIFVGFTEIRIEEPRGGTRVRTAQRNGHAAEYGAVS